MRTRNYPEVFVDREKELALLSQLMADTKNGKGCTVLISGAHGVGKTRLAEEFAVRCKQEGFVVLSSICLGEKEPPYFPILNLLESYRKSLAEKSSYVPLGLASFMEFELEERTPAALAKERTRMLEHLLLQFISIARNQPLLAFIDDLHLGDSATLAFFHYLARNIRKERIMVIATYVEEPGETETLFRKTLREMNIERLYTCIKLENFGEKEVQAMVESFGLKDTAIASYIYERTSGNPFFVVEVLTTILSAGIKRTDEIKRMELPSSVKEFVKNHIARLSERAKKVLTGCAILGSAFEYEVIAEIAGLEEEELLAGLEELIAQNILVESTEGYRFRSNTVREVVYGEITRLRKRVMHEKAGEILEKLHGKEENWWSQIAHHYLLGENKEKFVEYGIKAGKVAAKRFANAEAIELFENVLKVMSEAEESIEVMEELVDVLELEGRYDEALQILEKCISLTLSTNPIKAGIAHRKKAVIHINKGEYDLAIDAIESAENLLAEMPDAKAELAKVWSIRGVVHERKGEYMKAIAWQERAKHVFERTNAEIEIGRTINRIGVCCWYLGDYEKALRLFYEALAIREKLNNLREISASYNNLGIVYWNKGDYDKALEFYKKSLELKEKIGDVWGIAISYNNISIIYFNKGYYEESLELHKKSLELYEKIGDKWGLAITYNNIGTVYSEKGEFERGLEFFEKCLALAKEIGDKSTVYICLLEIALAYIGLKDFVRARQYLLEVKSHLSALSLKPVEAQFSYVSGKLFVGEGKIFEAEMELKKALEIYESMGRRDIDYYKALFELGKLKKDKNLLEKVLAFFEQIGNKVWIERVKNEIGE